MKFLIGLITAILITGVAGAQNINSPKGHVNFGIKGGINVYNVYNDNNVTYTQVTGYYFGLLGHVHLSSQWAIQPELVYSKQGAEYGGVKHTMDYVNVPVMLQYMFDNGFRIQAGPQLGILVSADNEADLNPIDAGVGFGASYIVPSTGFGIDARYNLGLSNINKTDAVKSTNRGFQLGFFYIFGHNTQKSGS